ncbi:MULTISPECIES: ankyrin repeat domain-containing protein [Silvimonas]|uniref:ankyrin repeat domain-containing protein n=1 Tax=Silvimonas TaxID=300264 RepID=UPI0024B35B5A|nr:MULTISPECIES: hypothetical protein [Silvimonas]MDR3428737.1 hypothetical protein [Silvimonas sp.]
MTKNEKESALPRLEVEKKGFSLFGGLLGVLLAVSACAVVAFAAVNYMSSSNSQTAWLLMYIGIPAMFVIPPISAVIGFIFGGYFFYKRLLRVSLKKKSWITGVVAFFFVLNYGYPLLMHWHYENKSAKEEKILEQENQLKSTAENSIEEALESQNPDELISLLDSNKSLNILTIFCDRTDYYNDFIGYKSPADTQVDRDFEKELGKIKTLEQASEISSQTISADMVLKAKQIIVNKYAFWGDWKHVDALASAGITIDGVWIANNRKNLPATFEDTHSYCKSHSMTSPTVMTAYWGSYFRQESRNDSVKNALLHGARADVVDDWHQSLLFECPSQKTVKLFIGKGGNVNQQNGEGYTGLHAAIAFQREKDKTDMETLKCIQALLQFGADPAIRSKNGKTIWNLLEKTDPHDQDQSSREQFYVQVKKLLESKNPSTVVLK